MHHTSCLAEMQCFPTSISAPTLAIILDGQTFYGTSAGNQISRKLDGIHSLRLTGQYSDSAAYAQSAMFESPDGGIIIPGTSHNISSNEKCNHHGNITGNLMLFTKAGVYRLIFRVHIAGEAHEAQVTLTLEGIVIIISRQCMYYDASHNLWKREIEDGYRC